MTTESYDVEIRKFATDAYIRLIGGVNAAFTASNQVPWIPTEAQLTSSIDNLALYIATGEVTNSRDIVVADGSEEST